MDNKKLQVEITLEELKTMSEVDIRTVDRSTLMDAESITINPEFSTEERISEYIRQIGNPYCYLYKGMAVKISFSGKRKLEDCLTDSLFPKSIDCEL